MMKSYLVVFLSFLSSAILWGEPNTQQQEYEDIIGRPYYFLSDTNTSNIRSVEESDDAQKQGWRIYDLKDPKKFRILNLSNGTRLEKAMWKSALSNGSTRNANGVAIVRVPKGSTNTQDPLQVSGVTSGFEGTIVRNGTGPLFLRTSLSGPLGGRELNVEDPDLAKSLAAIANTDTKVTLLGTRNFYLYDVDRILPTTASEIKSAQPQIKNPDFFGKVRLNGTNEFGKSEFIFIPNSHPERPIKIGLAYGEAFLRNKLMQAAGQVLDVEVDGYVENGVLGITKVRPNFKGNCPGTARKITQE